MGHVVGVHADHHLGVAAIQAAIQRAGDPLSRGANQDDPPISIGQARKDGCRPVARAVVHDHEREVTKGLAKDRYRGGADGSRRVASRQEDGGAGHPGGYPS